MLGLIRKIKDFFSCKKPVWMGFALSFIIISLSFFTLIQFTPVVISENTLDSPTIELDELDGVIKFEVDDDITKSYNESLYFISFVVPLYSKLNTSAIWGNMIRADIYTLILENPGITLGSITRQLKVKTGTATHHLRILEREGYIKARKTGKFKRFYVDGVKTSAYNEIQDKIIQKVYNQPGISQSDLARELEKSRQLINYHLKDLISLNVIKSERMGNKSLCFSCS